ncbi:MAG: response regulator transcription factor [Anaerolineales bacterium]|jgi:DNA-binding response OmpR family regulator|nr:response regulator transcription factor [Chloroflexota bacterium]MBK6648076.1 response regulator transcription factor [Anaerolineales bacterium]MCC6986144.1 response regulator transcription factor [Anaerolineales bacterium]
MTGRILIIDDEAPLRKTLARVLGNAGFEVTTAESAGQGLDFLRTTPYDLVLTDLRMPGMHGMDALKLIHAEHPQIAVVLFTAQPDVNSAVEALRHGATDYLLKPIKPEIIIERARAILAKRQTEKRKREIALQIESLQNELKSLEAGEAAQRPAPVPALNGAEKDRFLKRGALVLDLLTRRVLLGEEPINVPPTSFDYLLALARHAPNVVDYQTLVAEAQGYQTDPREAQELAKWHIHQLRQIIEQDSHNPRYLLNVRGTGYRLVAD